MKQFCVLSWRVGGFWERFLARGTLGKRLGKPHVNVMQQRSRVHGGSLLKDTCHVEGGRAKKTEIADPYVSECITPGSTLLWNLLQCKVINFFVV